MMLIVGGLFMAMGFMSGLLLVLEPLNALPFQPGLLSWVLFPALMLIGYGFILGASRNTVMVLTATRIAGAAFMALAVIATVSLFLIANSMVKTTHSTLVLWYVLAIGLVLGTAALAFPRPGKA